MSLRIVSIFDSVDGEANAFAGAGQPSTFIRLAGCNLRCSFCDTKYSYGDGLEMGLDQAVEQVRLPHVTITGGEPLLQAADVRTLCQALVVGGKTVTIETNGTIRPFDRVPDLRGNVRFVMDRKPPSAQVVDLSYEMRWQHAFYGLGPLDLVKFVVADDVDLRAALKVRDWFWRSGGDQPRRVYSPVWGIMDPGDLAEWVIRNDPLGQFSLQIHKVIWPNVGQGEER